MQTELRNTRYIAKLLSFYTICHMKIVVSILALVILGCNSKKSMPLFKDLTDKSDIEIHLSEYVLDSVPSEIGTLKKVERLYISQDTITGWTAYPPLSALGEERLAPPSKHLPDQITTLTNLKSLTLVGLDLVTLPDSFSRLNNLDTLNLYMNKLTISNELEKLKGLKRLKYIGLHGNKLTANDLKELKESIPGITTNPELR